MMIDRVIRYLTLAGLLAFAVLRAWQGDGEATALYALVAIGMLETWRLRRAVATWREVSDSWRAAAESASRIRVALHTADPGAAGGASEMPYTEYARVRVRRSRDPGDEP